MSGYRQLYVLHGWSVSLDNRAKWQGLIDQLKDFKIECQFVPLPGLDSQLDQVWQIDDYVSYLFKQIPDKASILGHSMGGQLAMRLAATHSEKVAKLILVDNSGIRSQKLPAKLKRLTFYAAAKVGRLFIKSQKARGLLYFLARESDYLKADPILRQTMANLLAHDSTQDAIKITCPTLIVWGKEDKVTPLWIGQRINRLIGRSQLKIIDGARHSPQFTHPNQVAEQVMTFIS